MTGRPTTTTTGDHRQIPGGGPRENPRPLSSQVPTLRNTTTTTTTATTTTTTTTTTGDQSNARITKCQNDKKYGKW